MLGFIKTKFSWVAYLCLLPVVGVYVLEAMLFEGIIQKYFFVSPIYVFFFCILLFIISAFRWKIHAVLGTFLLLLSLVFMALSFLLLYLNVLHHPNYVFHLLHIHPYPLFLLSSVLGIFGFISLLFARKLWMPTFLLIVAPLFVCLIVSIAWVTDATWYWYFKSEDSLVEYLTAIAYFGAAFFGLKSFFILRRKSFAQRHLRIVLLAGSLLFALVTFLIAAEEISWGQRIIGYGTPEVIEEVNYQNEFNFHNVEEFTNNIYYMYILMCVYGIFGWVISRGADRAFSRSVFSKTVSFFIPSWKYSMFFIPIALFSITRLFDAIPEYPNYIEETLEMILGFGIYWSGYDILNRAKEHKKR